ncbi:MAG: GDSL-type esterase/lipase family protein [Lachnospiraceae bacterium]|nr:GDSL-type esterase/lipase family protein [Lachnospiraceae bacterium]
MEEKKINWFRKSPLLCLLLISIVGYLGVPFLQTIWHSLQNDAVIESGAMEDNLLVTAESIADPDEAVEEIASVSGNQAKEDEIKEFEIVDRSYLEDAVFIGDSRTVGLEDYAGLEQSAFYAKTSLTIYEYDTLPFLKLEDSEEKLTVDQALQQHQFKKIYLMLGINELGTGTPEYFAAAYQKVIDRIRELQPDAVIFIQGIMRVTASKNESDPIFNNTHINERNFLLEQMADNRHIFYLEMNNAVCDQDGNLSAEYTFDEVHLKASYYGLWVDYLLQHGIK